MSFQDLFRGYTGSHGVSVATEEFDARGKKKHRHFTKPGAPVKTEWDNHLSGEGPGLGIIPLLDDNKNVYWGAIDIDQYPLDHASLERDAESLPLTITLSKSRGAHLWLFCKEPTPAKLVIAKLTEWAQALGFGGSEVFPKQHTRLVGKEDQGNWINLPYFGETRRCWYHGEEVPIEKFVQVAESRLVTEEILNRIEVENSDISQDLFSDGPPCLQALFAQGVSEGGRNNTLFNVGIYLKMKEPENWANLFPIFNQEHISPPLEDHEIRDSSKTLDRKPYNYTCSKHPLTANCNRKLCVKREFGIAKGSDTAELNVSLSGLTKIDTTTPRWFINIDGVRTEIPDTKVLMDQKQFGVLVVERVHKIMTAIKPKDWHIEVQRLLDTVEVVEAPIEASPEGQFILHLVSFIEKRAQSITRDSVISGRVWLCEKCNRAYFKPEAFLEYLRRAGFRDVSSTQMWSLLHDHGVKRVRWNIKGKGLVAWSVPAPELQDQNFDVPTFGQIQEKDNGGSEYTGTNDGSAF